MTAIEGDPPAAAAQADGTSQQYVSGGTRSELTGDAKLRFTNSMMQAYIAMRGPAMGEGSDPLFEWIKSRDTRPGNDQSALAQGEKKDALSMLQMIDKAIDSERMSSDTSRAAVFEIPKPPHQHITVQRPGNTERPVVQEKYFSWSDDEDDEEGGGPSGRISPGTFLAWARGSKRWDQGHIKDPQGLLANTGRIRPNIPTAPKNHLYPHYMQYKIPQRDILTGEEISPEYSVPQIPSIIYTPPGAYPHFMPTAFQERYNRMLPLVAQKHREFVYGKIRANVAPAGTNERYTKSTVDKAVRAKGFAIASLPGPQLQEFLQSRYHAIGLQQGVIYHVNSGLGAQQKRIEELNHNRCRLLNHCIPLLQTSHPERKAEMSSINDRIKDHILAHILDTEAYLDHLLTRHAELYQQYLANEQTIASLEEDIKAACMKVGMTSPQEVYAEVERLYPGLLSPGFTRETHPAAPTMYRHRSTETEAGPSTRPQAQAHAWQRMSSTAGNNQQQPKEGSSSEEYEGKGKGVSRRQPAPRQPTVTDDDDDQIM